MITEISIPDSVTAIEGYMFRGCTSLESFTVPSSIVAIDYGAFLGCASLAAITIPDSVATIGTIAFHSCTSLTSIVIPDSVTAIGFYPFYDCSSLASIAVDDSSSSYSSEGGVLFNKNKTELVAYPAGKPDASYTIPSTVIVAGTFRGCAALTTITIPSSVVSISAEDCSALSAIWFSATSAPDYSSVFNNIASSGTVYYPTGGMNYNKTWFNEQLTLWSPWAEYNTFDNWTFEPYDSSSTYTLTVVSGTGSGSYAEGAIVSVVASTPPIGQVFDKWELTSGNGSFGDANSIMTTFTMPSGAAIITATYKAEPAGDVTTPDYEFVAATGALTIKTNVGTTSWRNNQAIAHSAVQTVVFESAVTAIGERAFEDCAALGSLDIPNSVMTIGNSAFAFCKSLTSVAIPDSVITIGEGAFFDCDALVTVVIPSSVTSLGISAFNGCIALASITFTAMVAPDWPYTFLVASTGTVYYPAGGTNYNAEWFNEHLGWEDPGTFDGWTFEAYSTGSPLAFIDSAAYDIPASTVGIAITDINLSPAASGGTAPYTFGATGLPAGIVISTTGVLSGTPTAAAPAGTATITVTDDADASQSITINFATIAKGAQSAPANLSKTDESAQGAADGTISGVTTAMEYKLSGATNYTAITQTSLTGLVPGTYLVRFAETDNYNAGADAALTIAAYQALPVSTDPADSSANDTPTPTAGVAAATITLADQKTGVSVEADNNVLPTGTTLQALLVTNGADYQEAVVALKNVAQRFALYDLSLTDSAHVKIQPNGTVQVKVPLPAGYDPALTAVYYIDENEAKTLIESQVVDGMVIFSTNHFSLYAIVERNASAATTSSEQIVPTTTTAPSSEVPLASPISNEQEGSNLYWVLVSIVAAVLVVFAVCFVVVRLRRQAAASANKPGNSSGGAHV